MSFEAVDSGDAGVTVFESKKVSDLRRGGSSCAKSGIRGGARVGGSGSVDSRTTGSVAAALGTGVVHRDCECCDGGGDSMVKFMDSDVADVAKLSSSSFSSAMSSGMASDGRSFTSGSAVNGVSSDRNLRSESGDISLERLPSRDGGRTVLTSSDGVCDRES